MFDRNGGKRSVSTTAKVFQFRRLLLLTSVASLGGAALIFGPGYGPTLPLPSLAASARATEGQPRPIGFADIVERVKPAVISVRVKLDNNQQAMGPDEENGLPFRPGSPLDRFFRRFGSPEDGVPGSPRTPRGHNYALGQGSGFFISADGYAVTNNHVVDKSESVQVTADDGKTYTAKVIGTDSRTDLALIKVDGRDDFPFARLADSAPRVGDWVLAVGNPFGLGGTVTAGILSARGRDIGAGPYDDFLQIDAPVNKGNSGGPTFDVDGDVIGVNTAIFSPSGGSVGIAFAIPADTVKTVIAQLKDKGSVMRGWIGVQIQSVTPEIAESLGFKKTEGALVAEPQSGGPAAKAGIESGDVITSVGGYPIKDARDLAKRIGGMAPGTSVSLSVLHKGQEANVSLTLGELPKERQVKADTNREPRDKSGALGRLGLTLSPASEVDGAGTEGVAVTGVDPDSPAAERGFKTGDVILDVGGKAVSTPAELREAFRQARAEGKRAVLLRVKTGAGTRFVALPIGRA
jgi:serine protease Do